MQMPMWCGACDPATRRFDLGESERRCPHCHPYWAFGHSSIDPAKVPSTPAEQIQAARWLSYELIGLRVLPPAELRRRLTPFFDSGWTPLDVVHALDFDPDGSRVRTTPGAADPPELTKRAVLNLLASWCDEHAAPLPSLSQRAAERRRRMRERQMAARTSLERIASRRAHPGAAGSSGAREIARQAATRGKQIRLEGRHRESSHLLSTLAQQEAQDAKARQSLRELGKWRFGIVDGQAGQAGQATAKPVSKPDTSAHQDGRAAA